MLKNDLFDIGLKFKTDKVTHFFLHHYDDILNHLRSSKIRLLEIGVYKGASIKMWREYFPHAEIHCIDINQIDLSDLNDVTMHIVNCDNKNDLKNLAEKLGDFDIIIDDGGHTMRQQQNSFEVFWPKVKKDGIFIMEDMHTSIYNLYPGHNAENEPTTYDLFDSLIQNKDFHSSYISLDSYNEIKKSTNKIEIIWSKKKFSNRNNANTLYNASITAYVTKL